MDAPVCYSLRSSDAVAAATAAYGFDDKNHLAVAMQSVLRFRFSSLSFVLFLCVCASVCVCCSPYWFGVIARILVVVVRRKIQYHKTNTHAESHTHKEREERENTRTHVHIDRILMQMERTVVRTVRVWAKLKMALIERLEGWRSAH